MSAPPRTASEASDSLVVVNGPDEESEEPEEDDGTDLEPPVSGRTTVASTALTIFGVLLIGFVLQVVLISRVQHYRSQRIAYADLRNQLAQGIAPVAGLDSNGKPLKLGAPVALLEIPDLGLKEVVSNGTTSSVLMLGPGLRRDSVLPGQAGFSYIMGRRAAYGGPFAGLASLSVGSRITVTTGQGVQHFAVLDVRRAGDKAPNAPTSTEGRLVLMTATGGPFVPVGVLRVDARLTSTVQPGATPPFSTTQLPSNEQVLHGDPGAWLSIVLWGQALLLAALAFVWARARWGRWEAWLVGVPVLTAIGLAVADGVIRLLPNVL